jgi:hypothetical protein
MSLIPIIDVVSKVVDKLIPDPQAKAQLQLELSKLADQEAQRAHDEAMGQVEINKVEAAHRSLFVAGWRPFIGWVGGVGLATTYILNPLIQLFQGKTPSLDMGDLFILLGGLLGFGGLRSWDKLNGTSDDTPLGKPVPVPASVTPVATPAKKKKLDLWPF